MTVPDREARGAALPRHRQGFFLGTTLLIGLTLVLVLDPDDDDDDQPPVLPSATSTPSPTSASQDPKPGPLRMAKDFRLRPRKTGLKKRARTRHHFHESGPPPTSQQRPRRGLADAPQVAIPSVPGRLAADDHSIALQACAPTDAPRLTVAALPRLTRAPPA